ncbi:tail-anchored protein insertion receptor WRB [Lingula anatina]|uniref:Guided entry of tail-anchored proteins factor 1 n=1 Tax=Lingula anatina TaxID=7574 RepID=A0A1S3J0C1_LINAN|nr:tail-anchored protein insertion receptor WRB [Lingula anatina]|eukprot:XP_013403254.1 tail-anchored protein insertion receptor WRB [Lingula anatina]
MAWLLVAVFLIVLLYKAGRACLPVISTMISKILIKESTEEKNLKQKIIQLRMELKTISKLDHFPKYARCERKINSLNQELLEYNKPTAYKSTVVKFGVQGIFYTINILTILWFIWRYRGEPILHLPEEWVWPLGKIVAFPTGIPGAVGFTFWLVVCRTVVNKGLTCVTS